jgi:pimeloyl-ACP methyl ester carboxylesterase
VPVEMIMPSEYQRSDLETPSGRVACWELPGTEPTLLMLHDVGGDSTDWLPLIGHLCCGCRLLLMDYRCHGRSDAPSGGVAFDDLVADAVALVERSAAPRVVAAGHGLGGLVAMALAQQHPELVASLVLFDAPTKCDRFPADWTREADALPGAAQGRIDRRTAATKERFGAEHWGEFQHTLQQQDAHPFLERHGVRAIAVWGDRHLTRPGYDVLGYPQSLAVQHMWVDGAGHYLHLENPALCAHPVRRMLSVAAQG